MPVLWVPRINEQIQLPIAYEIQLEGLVPVEHQIACSHYRARFVHPVALQYAVQVPQATTSCNFCIELLYYINLIQVKLIW